MSLKLKSDRRNESRPESDDRRQLPRPPLWLNLALLFLALALGATAIGHKRFVDRKYAAVIEQQQVSPLEVNEVRDELAEMKLTETQLRHELVGRLEYVAQLDEEEFFIAIDTEEERMLFQYGDRVLREAPVRVGARQELESEEGDSWTFIPVKGAFRIVDKFYSPKWRVPEWVYVMNGEEIPETPPVIEAGLGRYVIELPHEYVIHSPPSESSPLKGPKPGSFMVDEEHLRAIWPRISKDTRVYIF
jgi:hypothetical protein